MVTVDMYLVVMAAMVQVGMFKTAGKERLQMWIDGKATKPLLGYSMDLPIIQNGIIIDYLHDAYFDNKLPVLPPELNQVELKWEAMNELYTYKFSALRSLDPKILFDPLLSIPQSGTIPNATSAFDVAIFCTGNQTSIASMYIVLHINDRWGSAIPNSPMQIHIRKSCIAFENKKICRDGCKNGGVCTSMGRCDCKTGYYGNQCQLAVCFPECINNGTCIKPGQCVCQHGFFGDKCQFAQCRRKCLHGGACASPDRCDCHMSHYGRYCQHLAGTCKIPCKNGGTCTNKNKCMCPKGYMGEFCQNAICKKSCGVHGRCIGVNTCDCKRGWRGRRCHKMESLKKYKKRRKRRKERSKKLRTELKERRRRNKDRRRKDDTEHAQFNQLSHIKSVLQ